MKKYILTGIMSLVSLFAVSQTDVTLKINHKLGIEDFALDMPAENNLGQSYKTSRLEYYISRFSIIHDGGIETEVPSDVIALVQPGTEIATLIPLGNYDVTSVEKIKFYIGVYQPINNEDPAAYDESHPLGPKSPSMHWGWASGYRFVAYEGYGGADYGQNFQLHGLGNPNYFRQEQTVVTEMVDGAMVLNLDANYTEALRDINVSTGVVSHGETGSALKLLQNFRDHVFGNYFAGVPTETPELAWSIYPNPTQNGIFQVQFNTVDQPYQIQLTNALGQVIQTIAVQSNTIIDFQLPDAGIYQVTVLVDNKIIATNRVIAL